MMFAGLNPPYSTIVADPPWPMPESGKRIHGRKDKKDDVWWANFVGRTSRVPYSTMDIDEISALPVAEIAGPSAHLYLWTTNKFLEESYSVVRAWGFRPGAVLTWCKPQMGIGFGGAFTSTTEFILTGRRGSLRNNGRVDSTWFQASRPYVNGHIDHSRKPQSFLAMIESVSPGPYLELFARQPRLGWDHWGYGYEGKSA